MIKSAYSEDRSPLYIAAILLFLGLYIAFRNPGVTTYDITSVNAGAARSLIDSGAMVIDVRGRNAFEATHIPGAISLPLEQLEAGIPAIYENLKAKDVVVYCGDGSTRGPKGTSLLNKAGFAHAVNLEAGITGWTRAGYPVVKK